MCVFWEFLEFYGLSLEMILLSSLFGSYSDNNNKNTSFLKEKNRGEKGIVFAI